MRNARLWFWGLVLLATAETLATLLVGRTLDDAMHPAVLQERGPFGLYDFLGPSDVPHYRSTGLLPWWTSPALSMRFFRPLSSLDLALDHLLLDSGGLLSHLHGLLWFLVLVALAYRLFVALVGFEAARFATPLYALANWHTMSLAFVAARHTVVTAVFALGSLLAFVHFVETGRRGALWMSTSLLALGLLAGESALLVAPLLIGWAGARRGLRSSAPRLLPHGVVIALYLLYYFAGGWGARGSALYLDPKSALFWRELPARWLSLAGDLLGSLAMDATLLGARPLQLLWGALALASAACALRWLHPRQSEVARNLTGLTLGALVALIPASAAMPGGRTLVVVGVAASALFGKVLATWLTEPSGERHTGWVGVWVLAGGVGLHPLFRGAMVWDLRRQGREMMELAEQLGRDCGGRLVLAAGTLDMNIGFVPYVLAKRGHELPLAVHVLSMAPGKHVLHQLAPDRYELSIDGDFFASIWSRNHSTEPLQPGTRVQLDHLSVHVERTKPVTLLELELDSSSPPCWVTSGARGLTFVTPHGDVASWTPREGH